LQFCYIIGGVSYVLCKDLKNVPFVISESSSYSCNTWIVFGGSIKIELDERELRGSPGGRNNKFWLRRFYLGLLLREMKVLIF